MSNVVYEAAVHTTEVSYKNFLGEVKTVELQFALDPLSLMEFVVNFQGKTVKSGNPAKAGEFTEASQISFIRDIAIASAGFASIDGDRWVRDEEFDTSLAGQAFVTLLASSDAVRREFAEKVVMKPFSAFIGYAEADSSNNAEELQQLRLVDTQLKKIFINDEGSSKESLEARKARLQAELDKIDG